MLFISRCYKLYLLNMTHNKKIVLNCKQSVCNNNVVFRSKTIMKTSVSSECTECLLYVFTCFNAKIDKLFNNMKMRQRSRFNCCAFCRNLFLKVNENDETIATSSCELILFKLNKYDYVLSLNP